MVQVGVMAERRVKPAGNPMGSRCATLDDNGAAIPGAAAGHAPGRAAGGVGFRRDPRESEESSRGFFNNLDERGLSGVKLVILDVQKGLIAALRG